MEPRGLAKGNAAQQTRDRTQRRATLQHALERVRQVAERDRDARFTALWHHVYDVGRLREAYLDLDRRAATGIDRVTWEAYGEALERNLLDLARRLRAGAYRARPVRRVYIPKPDGRQRPIGVPALEDKIVQRATADVLNAIYEVDFVGFSHGFRPGRSPHDALDAVTVGIQSRQVNWVLDADIRGFFEAIDHEWLLRFVEHRIADHRVLRHIRKWLCAGVMEEGVRKRSRQGTPQGGSISPLLANIYLHYVFDLWVRRWRQKRARGDMIVVRFADDFVVGFQHRFDAEEFQAELQSRLARFSLELHAEKTRLLEFGRTAVRSRQRKGLSKPETFDFLGFTHACSSLRNGEFVVRRKTMRSRLRRKLKHVHTELRRRLHQDAADVGKWLRVVLLGHYRYYGVPLNYPALAKFKLAVERLWFRTVWRKSQRAKLSWRQMRRRYFTRWLPPPRITREWPERRLRVWTRGRSPVR